MKALEFLITVGILKRKVSASELIKAVEELTSMFSVLTSKIIVYYSAIFFGLIVLSHTVYGLSCICI